MDEVSSQKSKKKRHFLLRKLSFDNKSKKSRLKTEQRSNFVDSQCPINQKDLREESFATQPKLSKIPNQRTYHTESVLRGLVNHENISFHHPNPPTEYYTNENNFQSETVYAKPRYTNVQYQESEEAGTRSKKLKRRSSLKNLLSSFKDDRKTPVKREVNNRNSKGYEMCDENLAHTSLPPLNYNTDRCSRTEKKSKRKKIGLFSFGSGISRSESTYKSFADSGDSLDAGVLSNSVRRKRSSLVGGDKRSSLVGGDITKCKKETHIISSDVNNVSDTKSIYATIRKSVRLRSKDYAHPEYSSTKGRKSSKVESDLMDNNHKKIPKQSNHSYNDYSSASSKNYVSIFPGTDEIYGRNRYANEANTSFDGQEYHTLTRSNPFRSSYGPISNKGKHMNDRNSSSVDAKVPYVSEAQEMWNHENSFEGEISFNSLQDTNSSYLISYENNAHKYSILTASDAMFNQNQQFSDYSDHSKQLNDRPNYFQHDTTPSIKSSLRKSGKSKLKKVNVRFLDQESETLNNDPLNNFNYTHHESTIPAKQKNYKLLYKNYKKAISNAFPKTNAVQKESSCSNQIKIDLYDDVLEDPVSNSNSIPESPYSFNDHDPYETIYPAISTENGLVSNINNVRNSDLVMDHLMVKQGRNSNESQDKVGHEYSYDENEKQDSEFNNLNIIDYTSQVPSYESSRKDDYDGSSVNSISSRIDSSLRHMTETYDSNIGNSLLSNDNSLDYVANTDVYSKPSRSKPREYTKKKLSGYENLSIIKEHLSKTWLRKQSREELDIGDNNVKPIGRGASKTSKKRLSSLFINEDSNHVDNLTQETGSYGKNSLDSFSENISEYDRNGNQIQIPAANPVFNSKILPNINLVGDEYHNAMLPPQRVNYLNGSSIFGLTKEEPYQVNPRPHRTSLNNLVEEYCGDVKVPYDMEYCGDDAKVPFDKSQIDEVETVSYDSPMGLVYIKEDKYEPEPKINYFQNLIENERYNFLREPYRSRDGFTENNERSIGRSDSIRSRTDSIRSRTDSVRSSTESNCLVPALSNDYSLNLEFSNSSSSNQESDSDSSCCSKASVIHCPPLDRSDQDTTSPDQELFLDDYDMPKTPSLKVSYQSLNDG